MGAKNQIQIIRRKEVEKDSEHFYSRISNEAYGEVVRICKPYEQILWIYFHRLRLNEYWDLSPQALMNEFGGSEKSWREARKGLIDKGYLRDLGNGLYEFVEKVEYRKEELGVIMRYQLDGDEEWIENDVVRLGDGSFKRVMEF